MYQSNLYAELSLLTVDTTSGKVSTLKLQESCGSILEIEFYCHNLFRTTLLGSLSIPNDLKVSKIVDYLAFKKVVNQFVVFYDVYFNIVNGTDKSLEGISLYK